uniref:hypothetical protein n=1 Tax=Pararhizobium sp. IMCC3301 TaxID=3067904 RepID=UPI002740574A|nr:hypothetical protein [Pararhizobium sp. IMCC3301]
MEFRAPTAAAQQNASACDYLTKNLTDKEAGLEQFQGLLDALGNSVERLPDWHPILTDPSQPYEKHVFGISQLETYRKCDHTVYFVRGFVTCPYDEGAADQLVEAVNRVERLHAHRMDEPLYNEGTYPVVVVSDKIELEADGTIRSRDALSMFAQHTVKHALTAQVAETWWNMRANILGVPHGSRSSLFVNQHAGGHMRKILETLNDSGMFGPIKEWSLDMLPEKKRNAIGVTLISVAVSNWANSSEKFEFELRGEKCEAGVRDTWDDGTELSVRVTIGDHDLYVSGFYYPKGERVEVGTTVGKKALALKFA